MCLQFWIYSFSHGNHLNLKYLNKGRMNLSKSTIEHIKKLCRDYNVKSLFTFGSVNRTDFKKESDIDFLVDFDETDPFKYTDSYFELKKNLEELLERKVDLIEERGIKNPFFRRELDETKVLIYG